MHNQCRQWLHSVLKHSMAPSLAYLNTIQSGGREDISFRYLGIPSPGLFHSLWLMFSVHQLPAPWSTPWATLSFVYFSQSLPPFLFVHVKATLYLNRSSLPLVSTGPPWKAIHNSASDALPLICTLSSLKCLGLDPLSPHPFQFVLSEAPKLMYSRTPAEAGHRKDNSDISFPQAEWLSPLWKSSQLLLFHTKSRVPD